MADNILLNAGSGGSTLATDDDATAHHQYVKVEFGPDNTQTKVSLTDGLPIQNETGGSITVDLGANNDVVASNSGTFAVQVDGAALTALQLLDDPVFADNAAFTLGTSKVSVQGGVYQTGTPTALADNDAGAILLNSTAGQMVELMASTAEVGNVTNSGTFAVQAAQSGTWTVDLGANNDVTVTNATAANLKAEVVGTGTFAVQAAGAVAHDGADSGNPIKIGGKAYAFDGTAPQTAVAEADRVNAIFTPEGRQYVETTHPRYFRAHGDYASAQTNVTLRAAAGAGLKLYITDVIVSNGATAGNITLLDGSGGTVLLELYPAVNGGLTHAFRTPLALTANTLLAVTSTTVTTHSVTVSGYIAA